LRETQQQVLRLEDGLSALSSEKDQYSASYNALRTEFETFQNQMQRELELKTKLSEQRDWESRERTRLEVKRREETQADLQSREKDQRIRELELQTKRCRPISPVPPPSPLPLKISRLESEAQSLSKSFAAVEFTNQSLANQVSKYSEERVALEQQILAERERAEDSESESHQLRAANNR
jgi:chromosome segregation ATPase